MGVERPLPGGDRCRGGLGGRLPILLPQNVGGFGFVFEFEAGFLEGHVDGEGAPVGMGDGLGSWSSWGVIPCRARGGRCLYTTSRARKWPAAR